jgi:hypothetical protein
MLGDVYLSCYLFICFLVNFAGCIDYTNLVSILLSKIVCEKENNSILRIHKWLCFHTK